jgi:glycosyltransferase involved in cell wall biosynthesis
MAVSEAAASGVLVAGTRVGLLSDWGEDYGIVTEVADARQLADRVLLAMDTPALTSSHIERAAMAAKARDSRWTSRAIGERIDRALQSSKIKKKIAVIGGGAHTIPTYRAMLKQLAPDYKLTLFSEFHLGQEWHGDTYTLHSPSPAKRPRRWRDALLLLTTVKHFLGDRPDVIHAHSTYPSGIVAVIAGRLFRIPAVVCLDAAEGSAVPGIGFGDLLHARRRKLNAWVLKHASALTTLTQFQRDQVRDNLSIRRKIHVIPRGVDLRQWTPHNAMPGRTLQLLSVAYLHPVKDHGTMLRAFQLIAKQVDARLTLVGKDYDNGNVQKLAAALGVANRVHFEGFVPHEMIASFYRAAHIVLHTSLFESQAMAVVEAMATGVLVCGTHVGIMADLAGECCVTVSPGDHVRLAEKALQLVRDETEQVRLRTNARKWVEAHDLQWTVRQYVALYDGLVR